MRKSFNLNKLYGYSVPTRLHWPLSQMGLVIEAYTRHISVKSGYEDTLTAASDNKQGLCASDVIF